MTNHKPRRSDTPLPARHLAGVDDMNVIREVSFPLTGSNSGSGLLCQPVGDGPHPGVLVLHDILGQTDDLERITTRFAASGYVALAPSYFGQGRKPVCVVKAMRSLAARQGESFEILDKARQWLADQPDVDAARMGAVGFCLGGGFAVLHATRNDDAFVGAFYGEVPDTASELAGVPPCFAGYGGRDLMFIKHGHRLKSHLGELNVPSDVRIYDNVGHSYMNQLSGILGRAAAYTPMRARYDEAAAEDSWAAMLRFFENQIAPIEPAT